MPFRQTPLIAAALALFLVPVGAPRAAEGALSHYLPGLAGDIAIAVPPEPGLTFASFTFFQSGDVGAAVRQGAVNLGLDVDVVLEVPVASYTVALPGVAATWTGSLALPFGYAELSAEVVGPERTFAASLDSFNMSDLVVTPLQLNWAAGNFSFKFAEAIIAPSGAYDVDEFVNLGRNYWSFDTIGAVTYLNPDTGTEASIAPGIMVNTTNDATDYRTGAEFHVDFTLNQFLSPTFALGLKGYYYRQVTGDSGSGALLGDFKSESLGLGPGFLWSPAALGGKLSIFGKYMRDVTATNRFDSHYGTLGIAWTF